MGVWITLGQALVAVACHSAYGEDTTASDAGAEASVVPLDANVVLSDAGGCGDGCATIWTSQTMPGSADYDNPAAIEVGVKFRADVDGYVYGVRFFKSAANGGTHVGSIWTPEGTLLESALFAGESESGWQEVRFATPVPVSANTLYIASYHAPRGHYARDLQFFAEAGVDRPPLHAVSDLESPNGVFAWDASTAFPYRSKEAVNYWVDVLFMPK